jgi:Fe-Mn family superoxide dismutase
MLIEMPVTAGGGTDAVIPFDNPRTPMPIDIARRQLLASAVALGVGASTIGRVHAAPGTPAAASLELTALPWDPAALAPVISAETIGYHHGKHHKGYVDNLVKLIAGTPLEGEALDAIVKASADKPDQVAIFNNAAQVWNHDFYWNSLSPDGGGVPGTALHPPRSSVRAGCGSRRNAPAASWWCSRPAMPIRR